MSVAMKSEAVNVRLSPAQREKLLILSKVAGVNNNLSAAVRWLVNEAALPSEAVVKALPALPGERARDVVPTGAHRN